VIGVEFRRLLAVMQEASLFFLSHGPDIST
jgi:hypothetical protein